MFTVLLCNIIYEFGSPIVCDYVQVFATLVLLVSCFGSDSWRTLREGC